MIWLAVFLRIDLGKVMRETLWKHFKLNKNDISRFQENSSCIANSFPLEYYKLGSIMASCGLRSVQETELKTNQKKDKAYAICFNQSQTLFNSILYNQSKTLFNSVSFTTNYKLCFMVSPTTNHNPW